MPLVRKPYFLPLDFGPEPRKSFLNRPSALRGPLTPPSLPLELQRSVKWVGLGVEVRRPEVIEGSSCKDSSFKYSSSEVEDETRLGTFPFSSPFSRTRQGNRQNLGLRLHHFEYETCDPGLFWSRARWVKEFLLIPQPFWGWDDTLENLCAGRLQEQLIRWYKNWKGEALFPLSTPSLCLRLQNK